MKKFIVYMHVFPNNKKYIGITCKKPNARWENGHGYSEKGQPVIYHAIQKYGWENVEHLILFENLTLEEAKEKEKELICQYKTNCHVYGTKYGYNMTDGGEGTKGHKCSIEAKEKMSKAKLGKYTGDNCYKSKAVICDNIRYESITEFCKVNNLGRAMVEKWFRGLSAMPKEWHDKNLRLENDCAEYAVQEKPWSYQIEYDGQLFLSQAAFAKHINKSPAIVCKWIKQNKILNYIKKKGFKRIVNSV